MVLICVPGGDRSCWKKGGGAGRSATGIKVSFRWRLLSLSLRVLTMGREGIERRLYFHQADNDGWLAKTRRALRPGANNKIMRTYTLI